MPRVKAFLNALATGILIVLLWDVRTSAWEPAGAALGLHHCARAVAGGRVLLACVAPGWAGLVPGFVIGALASAAGAWNLR
jgi:ZIP family zinc transporter